MCPIKHFFVTSTASNWYWEFHEDHVSAPKRTRRRKGWSRVPPEHLHIATNILFVYPIALPEELAEEIYARG